MILHRILGLIITKSYEEFDLAIVRSDAIGDFIIWKNALDEYIKSYEGKRILYICIEANKKVAEQTGYFTKVISFDKKRIVSDSHYHFNLYSILRRIHAKEVVCPSWSRHLSSDYIVGMIKADIKIGAKNFHDDFLSKQGDRFYTELVLYPQGIVSEFDAIEFFTNYFLHNDYKYSLSDLSYLITDDSRSIESDYCVVSLSSSMPQKDWPVEKFCEVLSGLPSRVSIILTGYGAKDLEKSLVVMKKLDATHDVINYVNKTSLVDLVKLISQSLFVLSNDSAAVHIAAACRVPSFCCLHGADFGRFLPYPKSVHDYEYHPVCLYKEIDCFCCRYHCIKPQTVESTFYCLMQVPASDVLNSIRERMDFAY